MNNMNMATMVMTLIASMVPLWTVQAETKLYTSESACAQLNEDLAKFGVITPVANASKFLEAPAYLSDHTDQDKPFESTVPNSQKNKGFLHQLGSFIMKIGENTFVAKVYDYFVRLFSCGSSKDDVTEPKLDPGALEKWAKKRHIMLSSPEQERFWLLVDPADQSFMHLFQGTYQVGEDEKIRLAFNETSRGRFAVKAQLTNCSGFVLNDILFVADNEVRRLYIYKLPPDDSDASKTLVEPLGEVSLDDFLNCSTADKEETRGIGTETSSGAWIYILLGVIGIMALGGLAFWFISKRSKTKRARYKFSPTSKLYRTVKSTSPRVTTSSSKGNRSLRAVGSKIGRIGNSSKSIKEKKPALQTSSQRLRTDSKRGSNISPNPTTEN